MIGLPASKLARLGGQYRTVTRQAEQPQTHTRSLSWRWDHDGMLVGSFRMPADEGVKFIAAVQAQQRSASVGPVDSATSTVVSTTLGIAGRLAAALEQI
jgi:hypothetical protein